MNWSEWGVIATITIVGTLVLVAAFAGVKHSSSCHDLVEVAAVRGEALSAAIVKHCEVGQ